MLADEIFSDPNCTGGTAHEEPSGSF